MVTVKTCEGKLTKPCGSFIYLGTLTSPSGSSTPETRRRIGIALGSFGSLHKVWKDKAISHITKARLYKALILTIMLYNAEIWRLVEHDIQALEGAHFRMMRKMMTVDGDQANYSRDKLKDAFHLHDIFDYIRQKRLRWIGHALRRKNHDRSKIAVLEALKDKHSPWTRLVAQDCIEIRTNLEKLPNFVNDRPKFSSVTHVCSLRQCGN
jgi:Mg2+ and Co2+ transporter CorA